MRAGIELAHGAESIRAKIPGAAMSHFERYIERVLRHEGGYVDHKRDPGGATNFGITQRTLERVRKVNPGAGLPANVRALTRDQAKFCYHSAYWLPIKGDQLPRHFAFQLLDAYVNTSPETVIRWAQRAAGVADDGILGPVTLAALHSTDPADLVFRFMAERMQYVTGLSTWDAFGKGWARGWAENLRYAAMDNDP
jgi:lysozyme family protein